MKIALAIGALVLLPCFYASAAETPPAEGPRTACKDDVAKLCSTVQSGRHRIMQCLKQNEAQVSDTCKAALGKSRERRTQSAPPSN